jgi:hypothetical protein
MGSVGEIFLGRFLRFFAPSQIVCFATTSPLYDIPVSDPSLNWLKVKVSPLPAEWTPQTRGRGSWRRKVQSAFRLPKLRRELEPIIEEAVAFGRDERVEAIWCILTGPSMILMASEIARRLKVPLLSLVWDPIRSYAHQQAADPISTFFLERQFEHVLKSSRMVAAVSEGMQADYKTLGVESVVIRYPIDQVISEAPPKVKSAHEPFVISYAGSLYAREEITCLIEALTDIKWQLGSRPVKLQFMGKWFALSPTRGPVNIEFTGHYSVDELTSLLGKSDLAYLPYWFDQKYEQAVRHSFPNKFSTYLAAGCPILFHGPSNSSPQHFLNRHKVGLGCNSLNKEAILSTLNRFVSDSGFEDDYREARRAAIATEFSEAVVRERFAAFLGVLPEQLRGSLASSAVHS